MARAEITVSIGGRDFKVLPLNLAGMRKIAESGVLKGLTGFDPAALSFEPQHVAAVQTVVLEILKRDAKDLTPEFVDENLDAENMPEVLPKILEGGGLVKRTQPGEAQGPKS